MQEERDDALHMLGVLSDNWNEKGPKAAPQAPGAEGVVMGNLQDSCQQFQYQLSAKLARCHSLLFAFCSAPCHASSLSLLAKAAVLVPLGTTCKAMSVLRFRPFNANHRSGLRPAVCLLSRRSGRANEPTSLSDCYAAWVWRGHGCLTDHAAHCTEKMMALRCSGA